MKFLIVVGALVTVASAAKYSKPLKEYFIDFANEPDINLITDEDNRPPSTFVGDVMKAKITSLKNINTGRGKFNYNFETQNGINIASIGKLKDEKTFVVSGSYSYTGADGKRYRVRYTADELGYHPVTELEEVESPEIVVQPKPAAAPKLTFAPIQVAPVNNNLNKGYQNNDNGYAYENGGDFGYGANDRTGKSLGQGGLSYNPNFISAYPVADAEPNRLYLPVNTSPAQVYSQAQTSQIRVQPAEPTFRPIPSNLPGPPPLPSLPPRPAQIVAQQPYAYIPPTESAYIVQQSRAYLPPQ